MMNLLELSLSSLGAVSLPRLMDSLDNGSDIRPSPISTLQSSTTSHSSRASFFDSATEAYARVAALYNRASGATAASRNITQYLN